MSRPTNPPEDYIGPCGCDEARDPWTRCDVCEANGWTPPTDDPATLRARLQERYERPERPCTYDPADEEPEGDWTPPRPEPVEYSEEREPCQVCEGGTRYVCCQCAANENNIRSAIRAAIERGDGDKGVSFTFAVTDPIARDVYTDPVTGLLDFPAVAPQGGPDLINPTDILYPCRCGARGIHACPLATRYPSDMFAAPAGPDPRNTIGGLSKKTFDPTWMDDMPVFRLGTKDKPGGFETFGEMRKRENPDPLRSYLRTLTNPDATPEDVNGALDALTPEDRALVSEALPSWGSARMVRFEAIAPFMARFKTMVRERDPRAHEEGTLLLSALLEDDPTRSTIEALMEIAKTPKVNP